MFRHPAGLRSGSLLVLLAGSTCRFHGCSIGSGVDSLLIVKVSTQQECKWSGRGYFRSRGSICGGVVLVHKEVGLTKSETLP